MRRCSICGVLNEDDSNVCVGCGVSFNPIRSSCPDIAAKHGDRTNRDEHGAIESVCRGIIDSAVIILGLVLILFVGSRIEECKSFTWHDDFEAGSRSRSVAADCVDVKSDEDDLLRDWPAFKTSIERTDLRPPYDIGLEFLGNTNAWKQTLRAFMIRHPGISYIKDGKDRITISSDKVRFFGFEVCEDTLIFCPAGVARIEVSLFNKGIANSLADACDGEATLKEIAEKLRGGSMNESLADDGAGMSIARYAWTGLWPPAVLADHGMRCIENKWCTEYLNFTLAFSGPQLNAADGKWRDHVRRSNGDVYIADIPMINQGQKGYCVPASIARVLRYYGIDCDMHELALVLKTACGGGTPLPWDFPALDRVVADLDLNRIDYGFNKIDGRTYIERYNEVAREVGERELFIEDFTEENVDGDGNVRRVRRYDLLYEAMKKDLIRKARLKNSDGYQEFILGVPEAITAGYPLIWSVEHHARLIIGFNQSREEVIYSDSWGSGHEFKRMSFEDAWSETVFMSCLYPK